MGRSWLYREQSVTDSLILVTSSVVTHVHLLLAGLFASFLEILRKNLLDLLGPAYSWLGFGGHRSGWSWFRFEPASGNF